MRVPTPGYQQALLGKFYDAARNFRGPKIKWAYLLPPITDQVLPTIHIRVRN